MSRVRSLQVVLLLVALGVAAAHGTLRLAIPGEEGALTPYTYRTGYPGYELMTLVYDQLMLLDEDLVARPWLAESLEIEDPRTYRLRLREGVRWHDGQPFDADDVAFSFDYYREHTMSRFTTAADRVERVETLGPHDVRLHLPAPDAAFVEAVLTDLPMLPEHLWAGVDDPRSVRDAIGTGPYRAAEVAGDRFYRLVANDDFWGPTPAVRELVAPMIRDETTTFQALRAGEIDAAVIGVPPASVASFERAGGIEVAHGSNFATMLLIMDVTRPGLRDPEVRRAIAAAIDVDRLVDLLLLGYGTPGAPGFLHPETPFANPATLEPSSRPPAEVRATFERAGYTEGEDGVYVGPDGTRLAFELLAPSDNPTRLRAAQLIAQDLAEIGVDATVRALEFDALTQRVWPGFDVSQGRDYEMAVFGWSAPVNVRANLRGLVHGDPQVGSFNLAGYADAEVDAWTEAAATAASADERRELLWAVQERIARDVPFVPLVYRDGLYAYRPAAFDGWSYQAGQGIVHKRSFLAD
jgi:peptide/nickel transport system substrate-binding protein